MADEGIDSFEYAPANQCFAMKHTTPFGVDSDMDQMKEMVRDADPGTVKSVAEGWSRLEKDLIGPGGVKEILDTAVEHVMASWEGRSADLFREQARIISTKLTDSSKYAHNVSQALTGAAVILEKVKPEVLAMEKPGKVSSAADFVANAGDRSGGKAADDAIRSGTGSQEALDSYGTSLSEGREAQLRMAAKMEVLGAAYNSRAAEMGSWKQKSPLPPDKYDDHEDYPGDPGGVAPAPVVVPAELVPRSPKAAATTGVSGRGQAVGTISSSKPVAPPSGVTGGAHKPTVTQPQVGTAIDGISGGRTGAPGVGDVGPVGGGSAGGGLGGGVGFVGGAVGRAAGAGAARGVAGRAGGVGGAAGAGAARGGASRAGGAAGRSGGVVGGVPKAAAGAGAGSGRGTTGGSGLHSSRGAAGRGGAGAVRKGGVAGVPGAHAGRREEEEQRDGERPDYLVEDEETWTPRTNAAPKVIE